MSEAPSASISRIDAEVGTARGSAVAAPVQLSRLLVQTLIGADAEASISRIDAEVGAPRGTLAPERVFASRFIVQVLATGDNTERVTPLALPNDEDAFFLHNWADAFELSTAFRTAIEYDPDTGQESRTGYAAKPQRVVRLTWVAKPHEHDGQRFLERMDTLLTRLTEASRPMPIVSDVRTIDANYTAGATVINNIDTTRGRWFVGGRIAVVGFDHGLGVADTVRFHEIDDLSSNSITLASALDGTNEITEGSVLYPCIDVHPLLETRATNVTARYQSVSMEFSEVQGPSQLPAVKSDNPSGAEVFDRRPVWSIDPDWSAAVQRGRIRHGRRRDRGRGELVELEGERSRETHGFQITGKDEDVWPAIEFFETRRGSLRSFWHIDQDQYFELLDVDPTGNFVSLRVVGDLADAQEEFEHIGLLMADGTTHTRAVANIQEVLTTFRVTVAEPLPTNLESASVVRVGRARVTRFDSDEITERWTTAGYITTSVNMVECLGESGTDDTIEIN